jgi:hypothetical protein
MSSCRRTSNCWRWGAGSCGGVACVGVCVHCACDRDAAATTDVRMSKALNRNRNPIETQRSWATSSTTRRWREGRWRPCTFARRSTSLGWTSSWSTSRRRRRRRGRPRPSESIPCSFHNTIFSILLSSLHLHNNNYSTSQQLTNNRPKPSATIQNPKGKRGRPRQQHGGGQRRRGALDRRSSRRRLNRRGLHRQRRRRGGAGGARRPPLHGSGVQAAVKHGSKAQGQGGREGASIGLLT